MMRSEWESELRKVGLDMEIFENVIAAAPANHIVAGYPQDGVISTFIQRNW